MHITEVIIIVALDAMNLICRVAIVLRDIVRTVVNTDTCNSIYGVIHPTLRLICRIPPRLVNLVVNNIKRFTLILRISQPTIDIMDV